MAVALTNTTVENSSGNSVESLTFSHDHTAGSNMLVVFVGSRTIMSASVTYGGVTMTSVAKYGNTDAEVEIFTLFDPPTGPSDVVVTLAVARRITVFARSASGATGLSAHNGASGDITSTRAEVTVTSAQGQLVLDSIHWATSTRTITYDEPQIGMTDEGVNEQANRGASSYRDAAAVSTTMGATFSGSTAWASAAISLEGDPPEAPVLSLIEKTNTSIEFSWTDSETWDGYQIRRNNEIIDEVPGNQFLYLDTGLTPETNYDYEVRGSRMS